jgi:hypothetical protein
VTVGGVVVLRDGLHAQADGVDQMIGQTWASLVRTFVFANPSVGDVANITPIPAVRGGLVIVKSAVAVKGAAATANLVRVLPAGVRIPLGNAKAGMEHILRRHGFSTIAAGPASKFGQGMGRIEIRAVIHEAARGSTAWRVEGASRVLEVNMGTRIGTDLAGSAASELRIVTDSAGVVITTYPIRWP